VKKFFKEERIMRKHAMIWPVLITIAVLLYGCGQLPDERLMEKGKRMEENERFEEAVACYMELDEKYPDSPHRAEALYHAGRVYSYGMNDFKEAIEMFQKVSNGYPDSNMAAQSQFMIGFIYANSLQDTANARVAYHRFLEKYPEHELVPSVQWELENLGKDINEIPVLKNIQ